MEVALINKFPEHGFEVWITDRIMIGEGMGSVFDSLDEALDYVREHEVPLLDLSHQEMPNIEGEELKRFLGQYLELDSYGEILAIKEN